MEDADVEIEISDEASDEDEFDTSSVAIVQSSASIETMDIDLDEGNLDIAFSLIEPEDALSEEQFNFGNENNDGYLSFQYDWYLNEDIDEPEYASSFDDGDPDFVPSEEEIRYMLRPTSNNNLWHLPPNSTTLATEENRENMGDNPVVVEVNKSIDCPICLDSLTGKEVASTKCGHIFCMVCITSALRRSAKCPICQKPLKGRGRFHPLFL